VTEVILAIATVLGTLGTLVGLTFAYLDYRERHRTQPPARPAPTPQQGPTPRRKPQPPFGDEALIDPERFAVAWEGTFAYLLGIIGAVVFWFSRRQPVRFHALQSFVIDLLAVAWFIGSALVAAIVQGILGQPKTPDFILNIVLGVLLSIELGIRALLIIQVARGKPGRLLVLWRPCWTISTTHGRRSK